ncbi:MAG TPA: hypothetical protein VEP90_26460, partial [Methylomirabilota bacterium]|nr:hypothetical protein [Methylomirabilota bacterium]
IEMKPILVKDLKKGMKIVECDCGENIYMRIVEDAQRIIDPLHGNDGWSSVAIDDENEEEIPLFQDHEITDYGPYLFLVG